LTDLEKKISIFETLISTSGIPACRLDRNSEFDPISKINNLIFSVLASLPAGRQVCGEKNLLVTPLLAVGRMYLASISIS
jgi:hypothetical protein